MRYHVIFRDAARREAVEAARYIAEHGSPEVARAWYEELVTALASLADHPHRCPLAREGGAFAGLELRQLLFKSHRILYVVNEDRVDVLHVRHASRSMLRDL